MKVRSNYSNTPVWTDVNAHSQLPKNIEHLDDLIKNLWWAWNYEATDLFNSIDPELWQKVAQNPITFIRSLSFEQLEKLASNPDFEKQLDAVYSKFSNYINTAPDSTKPSIAYFSMEYGLSHTLNIYSGGLGVLAGDYLKEASDSNIDLTAVGFLYRYGYFTQSLSIEGQQIANYEFQNFSLLPVEQVMDPQNPENPLVLEVPYPERTVYAKVWKVGVGRISLYLMDTDLEANSEWDRSITHQLYGGDWENRMKQEYLLGIGGIMLLNRLGIKKEVYHCNEGHAALINAQRLADYIQNDKLTFGQALEAVRASSLYTVHTPVPAGHDYFEEGLIGKYMGSFAGKLGISWQDFMDMGRENPGTSEKFSMSVFALNTCQEANGVSKLHGIVSQRMFAPVWKGYFPEELHVGYVTNGVHMPTWAAKDWKKLYEKYFDQSFYNDQSNTNIWDAIYNVPDEEIWQIRKKMKNRLIEYISGKFMHQWIKNQGDPSKVVSILENINPNALIIGFGRRFATYKRAHLLFTDLDRLRKIVNNEKFPVQFLYTGKAHPADGGGQGLIKHIVEISRRPEFLGKIIFLENYDMQLAKHLISGVDVWLNTPTRPLEASGTSGEKAEMNGVLNFSVLDGWWYEGYREKAGWALTEHRTYDNQQFQDELDSATIYGMLEREIIPLYFAKNSKGYSPEWILYIKNSIAKIAPHYTTKRMIDDYIDKFYSKLAARSQAITENNFAKAKNLAAWKESVNADWDDMEVVSVSQASPQEAANIIIGESFNIDVVIDKKGLKSDIGVELVICNIENNALKFKSAFRLTKVKEEGSVVSFNLKQRTQEPGIYKIALRAFPIHPDAPHRMDMAFVRWIH